MRTIPSQAITEAVERLCIRANTCIPADILKALREAKAQEPFAPAGRILGILEENDRLAQETAVPICQDTGTAVVYLEIGRDAHLDGDPEAAVNAGVARGYVHGWLRKSMVSDPLRRVNTGDNTPAVIHTRMVAGDRLRITVAPKGCGSENMSRLAMLTPAQGVDGVREFVLETVRQAGANPCPPMILGIGIGGDFESVAALAKEALLLPLDAHHPDPYYAELERELLELVNGTGIGPQGFGGRTTCLGVHVRTAATHIASLPVAVNVGCHVTRHASEIL